MPLKTLLIKLKKKKRLQKSIENKTTYMYQFFSKWHLIRFFMFSPKKKKFTENHNEPTSFYIKTLKEKKKILLI